MKDRKREERAGSQIPKERGTRGNWDKFYNIALHFAVEIEQRGRDPYGKEP